jgi:hypothetical protein
MRVIRSRLLFLTLFTVAGCAVEPDSGLRQWIGSIAFSNPGFESQFSGWTEVEPAAISSERRSGKRSAKLGESTGQVRRTISGLTPSTRYTVAAWVDGTARVGARNFGGTEVSQAVTSSSWTLAQATFTTGASNSSVQIFAAWAGGGDARIDDFTLVELGPEPEPTPVPVELTPGAAAVTASTSDTNLPANAVDGDLATRWSGYGDGAWLQLDLGSAHTVTHLLVAVHEGNLRRNRFDVQLSADGAAWTTAWTGESSGTTTALERIEVADATARYVRYVGHGCASGTTIKLWSSVTEIEVHGFAAAPAPEPQPEPTPEPEPTPTTCSYPAQVLDLAAWKITLPVGASESPTEIEQPALATYAVDPWFLPTAGCTGTRFRAHTAGVTTSGSGYPRSELREMKSDGVTNASWSTASGTHRMFIDQAITAVPRGKKHVVAGQIHDADDDVIVIRLEYPKLFIDINGSDGPTLDANYALGKRFTVELVASGGRIAIHYNGGVAPAYVLNRSASGCYFKAGAYTQSNCSTEADAGQSCGTDNYGEVEIYDVRVTHQ